MPTVTVLDKSGRTISFQVEDKSEAIREVSKKLLKEFSRASVEGALNKWLQARMAHPIKLTRGNETLTISYTS